jgi:hypothetical protein
VSLETAAFSLGKEGLHFQVPAGEGLPLVWTAGPMAFFEPRMVVLSSPTTRFKVSHDNPAAFADSPSVDTVGPIGEVLPSVERVHPPHHTPTGVWCTMLKNFPVMELSEAIENIGVAAKVKAEPGWYTVIGLPLTEEDSEVLTEEGKKADTQLLVFEIKEWGLPNPLIRPETTVPKPDLSLFGLEKMEVTPDLVKLTMKNLPAWLPLHPNDSSKFLAPLLTVAIYSPGEVASAEEALARTQKSLKAATEGLKAEDSTGDLFGDLFRRG